VLATKGFSEYSGVGNEFKSNNFSGKINVNFNFKTRMCKLPSIISLVGVA
jgi:hypothetical protein